MKKLLLFFLATIFLFTKCSTTKKALYSGGNGLSFETAVIINEHKEKKGVEAEYAWIKENYSNYKVKMQEVINHDSKKFDIINIELAEGKELPLYFNISQFYGKSSFLESHQRFQ